MADLIDSIKQYLEKECGSKKILSHTDNQAVICFSGSEKGSAQFYETHQFYQVCISGQNNNVDSFLLYRYPGSKYVPVIVEVPVTPKTELGADLKSLILTQKLDKQMTLENFVK